MKSGRIRKLLIIPSAAIFMFAALYSGITVRRYTIKTDKLNPGSNIKIILLTDLHSTIYGGNQKPLINKIKQENPDLILMAGDIADDKIPIDGTKMLLSGIKGIAPVYYVSGNHEYWSSDVKGIFSTIASFGVKILSDEYTEININGNTLIAAGSEDPAKPGYDWQVAAGEAFSGLDSSGGYKILLAHRPENVKSYAEFPFDLVVSGHAHGGQVRIPFILNGLYAPNQGWFPKYAGGLYDFAGMKLVVSRGLSVNPKLPRVFNPPELVVITIEG